MYLCGMVAAMATYDQTYIYGTHAVHEALTRLPGAVRHVYLVSGYDTDAFRTLARTHGIPFDHCGADNLPQGIERDARHQGVAALVSPASVLRPYRQFIEGLTITDATALLILDELTDPQNVGAIIRSAAAFGIAGVLIPEHRQAPVTGTVVRVSAGMTFVVPLVSVGNVNTVVRDLKERGFWVYGLVGEGDTSLPQESFTKPSLFIVGNEGRGIREKTEALCDFRLSIPIDPACESLNASVSAAVALYAWRAQHPAGQ